MRVIWKTSYNEERVTVIPDNMLRDLEEGELKEEIEEWVKDETDGKFTIISLDGKKV